MNAFATGGVAIRDLQSGHEIISRLSLANPGKAIVELAHFLDRLLTSPLDGETCFRLLETAREPIAFVAEELAKRCQNKPLPLAEIEEGIFQQVIALWVKTATGYAYCAEQEASEEGEASRARRVATILHRCIQHAGMAIIEHQRVRRECPSGLWLDLHGYYGRVEGLEIAILAIADALEPLGRNTHCAAAYISVLLCEMASPYSLSVRDQALVRRWANFWAPLVSLHKAEPGKSLPPFVVDLTQDMAVRPAAACLQTHDLRRLDTSRLVIQMSETKHQLLRKIPPSQLALGDDCTAGQCNRLLEHLSRPWSQARAPRKFRRHASSGMARLCTGFEEMYYFISGHEFEQPENVRIYSRREYDRLFAFRHQEDPLQVLHVQQEQVAYSVDRWDVVNQSANGFRLVRSIAGKKMAHGQLVALCPHDGERFLLAQTTWLMQEKGGGLIAGIRALPGLPTATAARAVEQTSEMRGKYHRAFLLPAVPAMAVEQSLVLPKGWFRPGRVIELFADSAWQVMLLNVLDDGPDFERASFAPC